MHRFWHAYVLIFVLSCPALMAQSARSYVAASVRLTRPDGPLADTVGLDMVAQYELRYIWSPSRNVLLGIGGSWMTPSTGNGSRSSTVASGPLSITQITATATWRPFKHGASPFLGVEGGFGFLSPPDSLASLPAFESTLGAAYGAHLGISVPLSERLEINASGRWMRLATSTPLDLLSVSLGLMYRIQ